MTSVEKAAYKQVTNKEAPFEGGKGDNDRVALGTSSKKPEHGKMSLDDLA